MELQTERRRDRRDRRCNVKELNSVLNERNSHIDPFHMHWKFLFRNSISK